MAFGEADSSRDAKLASLVEGMDRRILHHLRRAQAAAMGGSVRARVELAGVVDDLAMAMALMHADKAIAFDTDVPAGPRRGV
jgi:hypothetical protein